MEVFESRPGLVSRQLARSPYVAGAKFTAADISVSYALELARSGGDVALGEAEQAYLVRLSSYECGMDQPTYSPVQQIVERSGTLFFSFQDLDSTKPAGSVKIRVETIAHYLHKHRTDIVAKKKAAAPPGCPLPDRWRCL